MKAKLIAAGGLLLASAAFATATAAPATATSFPHCVFDAGYDGSWLRTHGDDIEIGTRRANVCKRIWDFHRYLPVPGHYYHGYNPDNYQGDTYQDDEGDDYDVETYDYDY